MTGRANTTGNVSIGTISSSTTGSESTPADDFAGVMTREKKDNGVAKLSLRCQNDGNKVFSSSTVIWRGL